MLKNKLKPCPFCGGKEIKIGTSDALECPYVYCGLCGAKGSIQCSDEQAINAWNRRGREEKKVMESIDRTKIKPGDRIWSEKIVPNVNVDYFLNKHEKIVKVFPVVKQELEKYCSCSNPERWSDRDTCIKCGLTIKSLKPIPALPGRINIECWSAGSCEEILRCKINEILGYLQKES